MCSVMISLGKKNPALRTTMYYVLKVGSRWKEWARFRARKLDERRECGVSGVVQ